MPDVLLKTLHMSTTVNNYNIAKKQHPIARKINMKSGGGRGEGSIIKHNKTVFLLVVHRVKMD